MARARGARYSLRPMRHTVMRDVFERTAPAPRGFANHGEGSWLVPPCEVVGANAIDIGAAVVIMEHGSLRVVGDDACTEPKLRVGDHVRLGRFVSIVCETRVELGESVSSSDCVTITDTWRDVACPGDGPGGLPVPDAEPVRIGPGAYLGYGCTIGPGVSVGEGAFVGEGAVVRDDVPPFTVVYGNPAAVVRRFNAKARSWEGPEWP